MNKSEIRKDYLLDKYVIITPSRAKRPRDIKEQTIIDRSQDCYFCPDQVAKQHKDMKGKYVIDEIKEKGKWQVVSVKNIFPAVSKDNKNAYGYQEVIIETPEHNKEIGQLTEGQIENILKMYTRRTKDLLKDKKIDYVLCMKNQGSKAGASKAHAHSQVFATNITPPTILQERDAVAKYKNEKGTCPYCDITKKESKSSRKIFEDSNIIAFTPYASEYHYEAWIFTKKHKDNITQLNEKEIKSLAKTLKKITSKLDSLSLPFNYFLHQSVGQKNQHFYLKVQPRGSVWAGVELGSGIVINSVPPEEAAKYYRE